VKKIQRWFKYFKVAAYLPASLHFPAAGSLFRPTGDAADNDDKEETEMNRCQILSIAPSNDDHPTKPDTLGEKA